MTSVINTATSQSPCTESWHDVHAGLCGEVTVSLTHYTSHAPSNSDLHNTKCDAYHLMGCTVLIVLLLHDAVPGMIHENILGNLPRILGASPYPTKAERVKLVFVEEVVTSLVFWTCWRKKIVRFISVSSSKPVCPEMKQWLLVTHKHLQELV